MYGSAILWLGSVFIVLPIAKVTKLHPCVTFACRFHLDSTEEEC
jgi:hypothetical protein